MKADGREIPLQKGNDALCVRCVRADAAQRCKDDRMMGDDQLRMKRQRLLDGLLRDIQHDEHTAHLAFRKAAEQPNIIKIQFERGWYTLFQITGYFTNRRHGISSSFP